MEINGFSDASDFTYGAIEADIDYFSKLQLSPVAKQWSPTNDYIR